MMYPQMKNHMCKYNIYIYYNYTTSSKFKPQPVAQLVRLEIVAAFGMRRVSGCRFATISWHGQQTCRLTPDYSSWWAGVP